MLSIYIVRHGQDEDNAKLILNGHRNKPLTALGKKQSLQMGQKLKRMRIDWSGFYVSPLTRTKQTAAIIGRELGLKKPEVMPNLIERDFGIMTGKPVADIVSLCGPRLIATEKINYFLDPYGAETFPQLLRRGRQALREIKEKHKNGNVLLVAHGDIGKMIFAAYYHLDWLTTIKMFYFDNSDVVLLAKGLNPKQAYISK